MNGRTLAEWFEPHGLACDLRDERYRDPEIIAASAHHIVEEVLANFIANRNADDVYHEAQERGFPWGAVRAPDELLSDGHLEDREFWTEVEHPELGRTYTYPGSGAIFNGSPWRIYRRAPLIGEHNEEIFGEELGLSPEELTRLSDSGVI